jgi:hypothetical protein
LMVLMSPAEYVRRKHVLSLGKSHLRWHTLSHNMFETPSQGVGTGSNII